jgi:hypothetical protein
MHRERWSAVAIRASVSLRLALDDQVTVIPKEDSMSFKNAIIFFLLFAFIVPVSAVQQTPNSSAQAAGSQANMANTAESAQIKRLASDDARSQQDDLRKMRVIVAQMEANLAFVDNTQSPLKHQFQLEIDMWKALLSTMERRAQANSR